MDAILASAYSAAATDPITAPTTAPVTSPVATTTTKVKTWYEKNSDVVNWALAIGAGVLALYAIKKLWFKA